MTNPVILLGTQSNGETLPVQVDATGRLVAEGLTGSPGPQGPPGPEGPPGPKGDDGGLILPPDPYEGALLGWLNNQLAWVGTPPVPIPEYVFGPIVSYSSNDGLIEIEGEIPDNIGNGVYVYQCDRGGNFSTTGALVYRKWSDFLTSSTGQWYAGNPPDSAFDGDPDTAANPSAGKGSTLLFTPPGGLGYLDSVEVLTDAFGGTGITLNDTITVPFINGNTWTPVVNGSSGTLTTLSISGDNYPALKGIRVDGKLLVDPLKGCYMRVNQVFDNFVLGNANPLFDFTPGQYLFVPEQRVAPWVLYGNDPTSLIDHLRKK